MGDKVDPNIVAPSRHAIFIRGLPGSIKVDEVRDYFCRDGHKCRVDFHSISDDKRRLFVALRFDSHEVAREIKHRYHGKEVLGHDVEISWFKDLRKARAKLLDLRYPARDRERMRFNSSGAGGGGGLMRSGDDRGGRGGGFGDRRFYGPRKPFYQGGPNFAARGGYRRPPFGGGGHFNRHSPFGGRYKDRSGGGSGERGSGGFARRRRSYSGGRSPRSASILSDDYDSRSRSSMSRSRSPGREHGRERPRSPSSGGSRSPLGEHGSRRRSRRRTTRSSSGLRGLRSRTRTSTPDDSGRDSSDDSDDSDVIDRRHRRRRHTDSSSGPETSGLVSHAAIVASQHTHPSNSASVNSSSGEITTSGLKSEALLGGVGPTGTDVGGGGMAMEEDLSLGPGSHFELGHPSQAYRSAAGVVLSPGTAALAPGVTSLPVACIPTPSEMDMASNPQLSDRRTLSRSKSPLIHTEKKKKKKKKKTKNKRASRSPGSITRGSSKSSRPDGAESKPHTPPDSMEDDDDAEEGQIKETLLRKVKRSSAKREKERLAAEAAENSYQELSPSHLKLLKNKKNLIEKAYKKDCKTFATVVKVLISKNPDLEDRLQASLRDVLQEIGQRCVEDLREFLRSMMGNGVGHGVELDPHAMERASSGESWHHHALMGAVAGAVGSAASAASGAAVVGSLVRSVAPRFDRQRAMAAAALEEGEAEESLPSSGSPLTHQRAAGRAAFSGRDTIKL